MKLPEYVLELNWGQNMAFGIIMNKDAFADLTVLKTEKLVQEAGAAFICRLFRSTPDGNQRPGQSVDG